MPKRIQLKRTKGWKMPAGAVKVDRTTKWGNPFIPIDQKNPVHVSKALESFRELMQSKGRFECAVGVEVSLARIPEWWEKYQLEELRGKDLACWCPLGSPCHGDILLELANPEEKTDAN